MKRMELTFWHKGKEPGEVVEVRDEEVRSWRGFAKLLPDGAQPEPDSAQPDPDRSKVPPSAPEEPRPAAKAKAAPAPKG